MKKFILLTGLLTTMFIGGYSANAAEDPEAIMGGGMEAPLNVSPEKASSAIKPRYSAGGGDFSCGVNGSKVWASYQHTRLTHSATAKNGWGGSVRDKQAANRRAYATANASLSGNTGWWNVY